MEYYLYNTLKSECNKSLREVWGLHYIFNATTLRNFVSAYPLFSIISISFYKTNEKCLIVINGNYIHLLVYDGPNREFVRVKKRPDTVRCQFDNKFNSKLILISIMNS